MSTLAACSTDALQTVLLTSQFQVSLRSFATVSLTGPFTEFHTVVLAERLSFALEAPIPLPRPFTVGRLMKLRAQAEFLVAMCHLVDENYAALVGVGVLW